MCGMSFNIFIYYIYIIGSGQQYRYKGINISRHNTHRNVDPKACVMGFRELINIVTQYILFNINTIYLGKYIVKLPETFILIKKKTVVEIERRRQDHYRLRQSIGISINTK